MRACTESEGFTQRPGRVVLYSNAQERGTGVNDSNVMVGR